MGNILRYEILLIMNIYNNIPNNEYLTKFHYVNYKLFISWLTNKKYKHYLFLSI